VGGTEKAITLVFLGINTPSLLVGYNKYNSFLPQKKALSSIFYFPLLTSPILLLFIPSHSYPPKLRFSILFRKKIQETFKKIKKITIDYIFLNKDLLILLYI